MNPTAKTPEYALPDEERADHAREDAPVDSPDELYEAYLRQCPRAARRERIGLGPALIYRTVVPVADSLPYARKGGS